MVMATTEASSVKGKPPYPHFQDVAQDSIINTVPAAEELLVQQDHVQEEIKVLKERIEELQQKLWEQSEVNAELKRTRQELSEEIMDLTKALFEEANGMVATEAKARAHLEIARRKLEGELEATKEQLRLEKQQLYELRGRFANDHSCERQDTPLGDSCEVKFDKRHLSTVLDNNYFGCLLPKHRFNSRIKFDGPAGDIWDTISQKVASEDLPEFSKFVEKCVIHT
jgi:predicted RNase H-like nuclease (RuvC/YqgF family)